MNRYSIVFKNDLIRRSEAAEALACKTDKLKCVNLAQGLSPKDIGHRSIVFENAGVCYADLNDETAGRLACHSHVSHIRRIESFSRDQSEEPTTSFTRERALTSPSLQPIPWHIQKIGADRCWDVATGRGVKVGVIDSEIDKDHPDLPIVEGETFHPDTDNWYDGNDYHGTFCAGIIGARNNSSGVVGVAPDSDLFALRVNQNGSGSIENIFAAMMWAKDRGLDVVSISQWNTSGARAPDEEPWPDMVRGASILNAAGCSVVGITGNSGGYPNHWVTNPGRCPNFIAVGGTQADDTWWGSSSFGPEDLEERMAVELVAPGSNVTSTVPGGGIASGGNGTSFACPHVSGLIALLKELHPDWSPDDLLAHMKATSVDLGSPGRDPKLGVGMIDAYAAVVGATV